MPRYRLGVHGVVDDWTPEQVVSAGFDPWMAQIVEGVRNPGQYGSQVFDWSGYGMGADPQAGVDWVTAEQLPQVSYNPGYIPTLLDWRAKAQAGTLSDLERQQYDQWVNSARAIPMRDVRGLTWDPSQSGFASGVLTGQSPDLGNLMLTIADKMDNGTATEQEKALYHQAEEALRYQSWRASVPQESDVGIGFGDNLFGALSMLGLGAGAAAAIAPLAAGAGLTFGSAAGLAGTAGSMTSMFGQALDSDALRKASIALGAAGGLSGAGSLLSGGLNSVSDYLSLAQKLYGAGSKIYGLTQGAGSTPDPAAAGLPRGPDDPDILYSMERTDPSQQGGVGSRTQAQTQAVTDGRSGGSTMDMNQLGPAIAGLLGLAGTGMSLADIARYMGQQSDVYGQQQGIKSFLDAAYLAAKERYDAYYGQTQRQHQQEQDAYGKEVARGDTYYTQTQQEQAHKEWARQAQASQIEEDRARQIGAWEQDRARVYGAFDERAAAAREERAAQIAAHQRRLAETDQERAMGMRGWEAAYGIGANLSDPTRIKAGAEAIYRPLSDLAVQRISDEVSADRSLRGLSGPGQYGDYLAAKAYAPYENQLWQTALSSYLQGQTGAISAYANRDLENTPMPDFTDLPQFAYGQRPEFAQQSVRNVPQTVDYRGEFAPPAATQYGRAPLPSTWTPTPYAPFGTTATTGGGAGGVLGQVGGAAEGLSGLVGRLTKLFGLGGGKSLEQMSNYDRTNLENAVKAAMSARPDLFGNLLGGTNVPSSFLGWGGDETQQPWYDPQYMDWSDSGDSSTSFMDAGTYYNEPYDELGYSGYDYDFSW